MVGVVVSARNNPQRLPASVYHVAWLPVPYSEPSRGKFSRFHRGLHRTRPKEPRRHASGAPRAQKIAFAPHNPAASRLTIGLRVTPRTATRGKTVTYLLRVSNVGDSAARLLRVCDQVPVRLILVSAPPGFVRGGGGLVCRRFASLPAGGTLIFKFRMQVPTSARGGVIVNTAYARASGMVSFIFAHAPLTVGVPVGCLSVLSITHLLR